MTSSAQHCNEVKICFRPELVTLPRQSCGMGWCSTPPMQWETLMAECLCRPDDLHSPQVVPPIPRGALSTPSSCVGLCFLECLIHHTWGKQGPRQMRPQNGVVSSQLHPQPHGQCLGSFPRASLPCFRNLLHGYAKLRRWHICASGDVST